LAGCTVAHDELHDEAESPNLLADSPKWGPSICLVNKSPLYMWRGRSALSAGVVVAIIKSQPLIPVRVLKGLRPARTPARRSRDTLTAQIKYVSDDVGEDSLATVTAIPSRSHNVSDTKCACVS
jgi:hypothetical protein